MFTNNKNQSILRTPLGHAIKLLQQNWPEYVSVRIVDFIQSKKSSTVQMCLSEKNHRRPPYTQKNVDAPPPYIPKNQSPMLLPIFGFKPTLSLLMGNLAYRFWLSTIQYSLTQRCPTKMFLVASFATFVATKSLLSPQFREICHKTAIQLTFFTIKQPM